MTTDAPGKTLTVAEVLDFESRGAGSRTRGTSSAIAAAFKMTSVRYRQQLLRILTTPALLREALELDAITTNRLLEHHQATIAARIELTREGAR